MQVESSPDEVRRSSRVKKRRNNFVEDDTGPEADTEPYDGSPAKAAE